MTKLLAIKIVEEGARVDMPPRIQESKIVYAKHSYMKSNSTKHKTNYSSLYCYATLEKFSADVLVRRPKLASVDLQIHKISAF